MKIMTLNPIDWMMMMMMMMGLVRKMIEMILISTQSEVEEGFLALQKKKLKLEWLNILLWMWAKCED